MDDKEQKIKISFETNADDVAGKVDKLTTATDNTSKAQAKSGKSAKDMAAGLQSIDGPIGNTISGLKGMLKQMWLIVANPLGLILVAIVGALTLLFKAFTSTNAGADKLDQIMAGLSATLDVLRDRFLKIAGAIAKFMTGDFKGAMEDGKAAVSGFGDEVAAEFQKAANATKALQDVEDAMRDLGVTRAKLNRDLAESKEIIGDETASYGEKKKAIDDVRKAEGEQTAQELANAKKKLKAIKDLNALSDTSDEDLQKAADAQSAVYKLEEEQSQNKRALNKLDKKADNEEKARLKVIADERNARIKENIAAEKARQKVIADLKKQGLDAEAAALKANQDLNDKTEEEKLARQKQRAADELEILRKKGIDIEGLTRLNAEKFATLESELAAKRLEEKKIENQKLFDAETEAKNKQAAEDLENQKAIDAAKLELAQSLENAKVAITDKALNLFGILAGKNKKLQKAAIIAEGAVGLARTVRSTAEGNSGALALGILQAGPVAGPAIAAPAITANTISGALSGATIIAQTGLALKALGGGGGGLSSSGGRGNAPAGGGATSAAPQVNFQGSSENQIGNTLARNTNEQPPIQAFVVESAVTTAQSLANNRITSNSI